MSVPARVLAGMLWLLLFSSSGVFAYQPFFDNDPSSRYAPQDPPLTDFDLDVLLLCAGWGDEVKATDFEQMLLAPSNSLVLARIRQALASRIYTRSESDRQFVRELRRLWFEQKGFKHVFCGEPSIDRLGGLHYAARYWQAQDEGWAGYRPLKADYKKRPQPACRKFFLRQQIKPPVYSISMEYRRPQQAASGIKCLGGYNREMSAEDILIAATAAFKQAYRRLRQKRGSNTQACLYAVNLAGKSKHYSTLVIKRDALRTFYPLADKKPYCASNKRDFSACLCSHL
ncbi:MAG: EndoU domain-containing protein [gamma proteobacterium symbiont of Bathyaustriella thionipta]|nr:EndoU domain-containing protein [gamma proteobacterium symbiont of Bathyaustriella thionipta]